MPLLLICGPPASGKTTRANKLKEYFQNLIKKEVIIVNEEFLQLTKQEAYKDGVSEKMTRGFLKSNVEKHIQSGGLVIFDSINYIKGYRYEIYCISRAVKTSYCLLYCKTPLEVCCQWNKGRENKFEDELLETLFKRMEVPKQKDRWDSPYFEVRYNEETPFAEIEDILFNSEKKAKDPVATKIEKQQEGNFVQEQEKRVQDLIDFVLKNQNMCLEMGNGVLSYKGFKPELMLKRQFTLVEMKKIRLEFFNMLRVNPIKNLDQTEQVFLNFLQHQIERNN